MKYSLMFSIRFFFFFCFVSFIFQHILFDDDNYYFAADDNVVSIEVAVCCDVVDFRVNGLTMVLLSTELQNIS